MLLLRSLWVIALSISSAAAFKDTSPFLLFSSAPISTPIALSSNIARSSTIRDSLSELLKTCDWDNYILVSQPSQSPADFSNWGAYPHIRRWLEKRDDTVKTATAVPEVIGEIDIDAIAQQLELGCKATVEDVETSAGYAPIGNESKRVRKIVFDALPSLASERAEKIMEHDLFLNAVLSGMQEQSYIVIYTSTPASAHSDSMPEHELHLYEMDDPFPSALHTDLKRDVNAHQSNSTVNSTLPLFERYEYFNPAIFTGILVAIPLFLILYTGISAVASLQVSYFAFSKEMGPAAQKKQQ
ncbi:BIG1-domain-containing protein [Rhizodiscina lignyota]|uniref:Protein BIG1 n=1 Tax=Rhizodiscina lignyota TaxID=1504668 RepID=A0A9P4ICQ0_9PEZI|nr:BIG1-domain-containing protein [Rhizodiscina lignyota]